LTEFNIRCSTFISLLFDQIGCLRQPAAGLTPGETSKKIKALDNIDSQLSLYFRTPNASPAE
jgi:hypothetical protein